MEIAKSIVQYVEVSAENEEGTTSGVKREMENNSSRHNFARTLLKNCVSIILVSLLFVLGLMDAKAAVAASPFTPGKLVGTYNLTSASSVKQKGGTMHFRPVMTVSEGGNGTVVIATGGSKQKWKGVIDPNTGKGVCKMPITNKSGKVVGTTNAEVRFTHLGGGNYSLNVMGLATYQKKGAGTPAPASPSATQKVKSQKPDKTQQNKTDKQNYTTKQSNAIKQNTDDKTDGKQTDDKDLSDPGEEEYDRDDLPESDVGKTAAAVGTALAGGLLGLAGAVGGALGGGAGGAAGGMMGGGAGGATGSAGGGYDGYSGSDNGLSKNSYEDEYSEDYEEEPGEDYNDEPGEKYEEEPDGENEDESGEDYEDEPDEENEDESGEENEEEPDEENEDESGEENEDEPDEENEDESGEDYEDEPDEENNDESGDNYDDEERDDYNDGQNDYDENREEERDDYEDKAADDSAEDKQDDSGDNYADSSDDQDDTAEPEDEPEPPDYIQDEPPADNMLVKTIPENLIVADDGSIHVMVPSGEELVYTRNEDGTYNMPTQTETGEDLTYFDEDGNVHPVEPGMLVSQEQVLADAQWYKDHEQEILADRAAEDARQQAERDRLAAENAKWLEKERAINSQLSRTSIELREELRQMEQQNVKNDFVEKMRWKYGHGDPSLTKQDLIKLMKQEQIKNKIEGAYHEKDAAAWDEHIVTAQEVKFVADQSVMAYSTLTHNQAFANLYNAATNYGETMMDAVVNKKDLGKAFVKATIDTGLDMTANKFEDHGFHITGNAFAGAYKQVNDNLYNGRDAWDGTDSAALKGGVMGLVNKGTGKLVEKSQGTVLGTEIGGTKTKVDFDQNVHSTKPDMDTGASRPRPDTGAEPRKTTIAERRTGQGEYKTNTPTSDAQAKAQLHEDLQANRSMNEVRKLDKISKQMDAIEKSNPKNFRNDPEYQKLSQQFEAQHKVVREDKVAIDRMNALQGETGTNLRKHYNQTDMAYEKKVLQYRNESIAQEYGLKPNQIGDTNVTSNKDSLKAAGGKASHDTDTSPYMKVNTGEGKNAKVDFTQVDGDHHLVRAVYKAEHGRYPQTAAEYAEGQRLKQLRDFTNVSTRPSDTHELSHNPDAYVGSSKGDVNRVLEPEKFGTPEKGTGVFNEQTAIHKQGAPLERHHQQYAEAQKLREQLKTDNNLSAAEKTEVGKKIADLERQSASNHYESVRTTAKEFNVIKRINDVNIKKGLGDGLSKEAKQIGKWANQVANGEMDAGTYKKLVTEQFGSEENALKIVAKGFRDTNK